VMAPGEAGKKEAIEREIGIMQMTSNNFTVKCFDAFLYQNHYWIFLELMEGGSFTPVCEGLMGDIAEEACKYSLNSVLKGLIELHRRNIIHRDIKSDNILVSR